MWQAMPDSPIALGTEVAAPAGVRIANHYSAALSELDLAMVRAVPPGGNWKDIPETVPSERLAQIRRNYRAGGGSRSTYYGRLRPDLPAYTITTNFNRPGNGCHIHYDYERGQHRLISQREAARLQSFPDSFAFLGKRGSVNKQIGNAVPPLLAYQLAEVFGAPGRFVDLFAGAGGLSLGFVLAGWWPIAASDIDEVFLSTHRANIGSVVIPGDIRDPNTVAGILSAVAADNRRPSDCFLLLGGPPCQGFSTAGNRRSAEDERNRLFEQYRNVLALLRPDAFLFENVPGILNLDGGSVFRLIRDKLGGEGYTTSVWRLRADGFGVPQRRERVFLVGAREGVPLPSRPAPVTAFVAAGSLLGPLAPAVSVAEALSDLPSLEPGEDGSYKDYLCPPSTAYQQFVRGHLTARAYLHALRGRSNNDQRG